MGKKNCLARQKKHHTANRLFSDVIGVYYGQTYFGADAKVDVEDMIHPLKICSIA